MVRSSLMAPGLTSLYRLMHLPIIVNTAATAATVATVGKMVEPYGSTTGSGLGINPSMASATGGLGTWESASALHSGRQP